MQTSGFKRVVLLAMVAGIAFWAWRASQSTSQPGAVAEAPRPGAANGEAVKTPDAAVKPASSQGSRAVDSPDAAAAQTPSDAAEVPEKRPALVIAPGMAASQEPFYRVIQDIGYVQALLGDFRSALGGNPVGSNAEIIRALLGRNPKKLTLALREDQKLNANGELVDPWGTPYFFHQLSGQEMHIRCAGPDGKLWNKDDISPQ